MKHYYATSPVQELRLGETELISAGEEILSRARVLAEALARKVEKTVDREAIMAGNAGTGPGQFDEQ